MTEPRRRTAVRVLPIDDHDRVLLLHGFDPARPAEPYWFTVGGGLEPDETETQAAVRELAEEVGIRVRPEALVGPLGAAEIEFRFDGVRYVQWQTYYAVRVPTDSMITFDGQDAIEHASIDRHAWWTGDQLARTNERCFPDDLAQLITRALTALR